MIARPERPENAETLFRAVAAVADALYVVGAAGRITFLNPAALKILGYADEDELLGCPSHETIHYLRPDGLPFPAAECPLLPRTHHHTSVSGHCEGPILCRKSATTASTQSSAQ